MYCKFSKLSTFLKNDLKSLSSSSFLLIIYSVFFKLLLNPNGLPYIFSSQEISLSFNARHPIPSHPIIVPGTQATSVRFSIVCYFLLLGIHESFKQENIVHSVAHLYTEDKVLYTSNIAYYVPAKNLGRRGELQKDPKCGSFCSAL